MSDGESAACRAKCRTGRRLRAAPMLAARRRRARERLQAGVAHVLPAQRKRQMALRRYVPLLRCRQELEHACLAVAAARLLRVR